ncbi:MAG: hypothetical protein ACNA8L_00445 [Luteolibacter sp.]
MMAVNRTEYARPDRQDGLIFDWRRSRSSRFGKLGLIATAMLVFILPLSVVRIDLGKQPIQEANAASVMMLTPGNDPMHWLEAARGLGPFPTRFEPAGWVPSQLAVDDVIDRIRAEAIPPYQPRLMDFPAEDSPSMVPLVAKGARILPAVRPPSFQSMNALRLRTVPVLQSLSSGMGDLPDASPPFEGEVTSEMVAHPWRFLLQISPEGMVRNAVALTGQNVPGRPALKGWLESHRFPSIDQPNDRWMALTVSFQNQTDDGAVDP